MALDWETFEPAWIRGLGEVLPDEVTDTYLSAPDDGIVNRSARLLAVTPGGLFGCRVEAQFDNRGNWESVLNVEWRPLAVVQAVRLRSHAGRAWGPKDHEVTITLDRDLPGFGEQIDLPLSTSDYGGREEARQAARRFAVSVLGLLS